MGCSHNPPLISTWNGSHFARLIVRKVWGAHDAEFFGILHQPLFIMDRTILFVESLQLGTKLAAHYFALGLRLL
jgi:hypothetical protein